MLISEQITTCLAVVAALCVNDTATVNISPGPGWVGAVVTLKRVKITSTISSDAIISPYKKSMQELCLNGACTFYKGYCGQSKRKYTCNVWYSFDGVASLRRVEITGDQTSVLSVRGRVKLVRSADTMFPLSAFHYDASDDLPPTCYVRQGCAVD